LNPPSYAELSAAWKALRGRHGISVREVACAGAPRTLLLAEIPGEPGAPAVAISAGVHGDEPAAPWALLSLVRDGLLDRQFSYRVWPCTNPTGYALGTRANAEGHDINRSFNRGGTTPEARAIITANRDRRFELVFDLHEDFEAAGFYCYEPSADGSAPLGPAIIAALDEEGLPVQTLDASFDIGYPPEAHHLRRIKRGHIIPDPAAERAFFDGLAYSLYMLRRAARRALTVESPRTRPWAERLAIHRIAVVTALAHLRGLGRLPAV